MSMRSEPMVRVDKRADKDNLFTPGIRAEIDRWVAKYPEGWQQSAVMAALMVVNRLWMATARGRTASPVTNR